MVESPAELHDRSPTLLVETELGRDGAGTVDEQLHGRRVHPVTGETADGQQRLTIDHQRLTAGGQDAGRGGGLCLSLEPGHDGWLIFSNLITERIGKLLAAPDNELVGVQLELGSSTVHLAHEFVDHRHLRPPRLQVQGRHSPDG